MWRGTQRDGDILLWAVMTPQEPHAKITCLGGQLFAFIDTHAEARLWEVGELRDWTQTDLCSDRSSILISCERVARSFHLPVPGFLMCKRQITVTPSSQGFIKAQGD